jgi:predicted RNA polymerase sigma factor
VSILRRAVRGLCRRPVLQTAIAACHARAATPDDIDWEEIAALYEILARISPSPVVELNRAVAVGMASGPAEGLELADALLGERALANYALLPAVRGDFLAKLGRADQAGREFERAAALTRNEWERGCSWSARPRRAAAPDLALAQASPDALGGLGFSRRCTRSRFRVRITRM